MTIDGRDAKRRLRQVLGQPTLDRNHRLAVAVQAMAGLLGAAGVATAAAGAHKGGGELVSTASTFMLIHAAAALALCASARASGRVGSSVAAIVLIAGTIFFAGDLVLAGLFDWRPLPMAAPVGGMLLIVGWLAVPAALLVEGVAVRR